MPEVPSFMWFCTLKGRIHHLLWSKSWGESKNQKKRSDKIEDIGIHSRLDLLITILKRFSLVFLILKREPLAKVGSYLSILCCSPKCLHYDFGSKLAWICLHTSHLAALCTPKARKLRQIGFRCKGELDFATQWLKSWFIGPSTGCGSRRAGGY